MSALGRSCIHLHPLQIDWPALHRPPRAGRGAHAGQGRPPGGEARVRAAQPPAGQAGGDFGYVSLIQGAVDCERQAARFKEKMSL